MKLIIGLKADLGNSESRIRATCGEYAIRFNLPNRFALLPDRYPISKNYVNNKSSVIVHPYTREVDGAHHEVLGFFANGLLAEKEFMGMLKRPTNQFSKAEQDVTYMTIHLAMYRSIIYFAELYRIKDIENLEVEFNVYLLLPPLDQARHEALLIKKVKEIDSVRGYLPHNLDLPVKVTNVTVHPESVAMFFGTFFKEMGARPIKANEGRSLYDGSYLIYDSGLNVEFVEVAENTKFAKGYTIVLDIGAGTTDVAVFKDMELIESSKDTLEHGGMLVNTTLRKLVATQLGYKITELEEAVKTATITDGAKTIDISKQVLAAKDAYVKATMSDLTGYFEGLAISTREIRGVLVGGGGALPSVRNIDGKDHIVVPSMGELLLNELKAWTPNVELVHTDKLNLRNLNIDGLTIMYAYETLEDE